MIKMKMMKAKTKANRKCTLHKNGNLGFSLQAIETMKICDYKSASIGIDEDDKENKFLYIRLNTEDVEDDFKIKHSGDYYAIKTKTLFDELGIDYEDTKRTIIYDIEDFEFENEKWYRLKKREVKRYERKKNERL